MTAILLDGKTLAQQIEQNLIKRVQKIREKSGKVPALATLLVGDDPASATYVRMKGNACQRVGMRFEKILLATTTTTQELLDRIGQLNADPDVHGILLQHPVPSQIEERHCFDHINLHKDVDGVTCHGFGRITMGEPAYGSATPQGIMTLLSHYQIPLSGQHAVIVGRSPILGKPMAMMLLNANATITICHSQTRNLPDRVREADIVIGAVGKPEFIKASWIKEGGVVVDAGYHPQKVGDIELAGVVNSCFAYTPVPGGVGPMTIASLISQTVEAVEKQINLL